MTEELASRLDRIERLLTSLLNEQPHREFCTVQQAATRLGLASWTVRNRCRLGEILAEKDRGGQWLIHQSEIDRLENNRHRLND